MQQRWLFNCMKWFNPRLLLQPIYWYRRGAVTDPQTVIKTIQRLMIADDPRISLFVAVDIVKVPPVDYRNIDRAHIISHNRDIRIKLSSHSAAIKKIQQALDEVLSLGIALCSCDCNAEKVPKIEMFITTMQAGRKSASVPEGINTPIKKDLLASEGPVSGYAFGDAFLAPLHALTVSPTSLPLHRRSTNYPTFSSSTTTATIIDITTTNANRHCLHLHCYHYHSDGWRLEPTQNRVPWYGMKGNLYVR